MSGSTQETKPTPVALRRFREIAGAYRKRIQDFGASFRETTSSHPDLVGNGNEIAFLITPWLATPVPFFSIEMALLLQKAGATVRLLYDDSDIARHRLHREFCEILDETVRDLEAIVPVSRVGDYLPGKLEHDPVRFERVTRNLAIWMERGEGRYEKFYEDHPELEEEIASQISRICSALSGLKVGHLVIPGGFFGTSGLHRCAAEKLGISFTTYDSSGIVLLSGQNAPAGHQKDLIEVFRKRWSRLDGETARRARAVAFDEIERRRKGTDTYGWHRDPGEGASGPAEAPAYDILALLNIRWDAAGLDLEACFGSVREWLSALLDWLESAEGVTLCIREHPKGNIDLSGEDDFSDLVANRPGLAGRVRYVKGDEAMNTYRAIERCKVVLPWSTSAGIEAAILGKPVVVQTSVYYGDMGFCEKAETAEEYFSVINNIVRHPYELAVEKRAAAEFAFFLVHRCSCFETSFNPCAAPFSDWVEIDPNDLLARPDVIDVLHSMTGRRPLSDCAFERWVKGVNVSA